MSQSIIHVCSFRDAEGSCVIAGKTWRWEFSELFGPLFLKKNGEPLKHQPMPPHPVWQRFEEWQATTKWARKP